MSQQIDPLARTLADANGLDLSTVRGTGPDGQITQQDVIRALEEQTGAKPQGDQLASNPGCLFGLFK